MKTLRNIALFTLILTLPSCSAHYAGKFSMGFEVKEPKCCEDK